MDNKYKPNNARFVLREALKELKWQNYGMVKDLINEAINELNASVETIGHLADVEKMLNTAPQLERFRVWWNKNTETDGMIYERDLDEFIESEKH